MVVVADMAASDKTSTGSVPVLHRQVVAERSPLDMTDTNLFATASARR
jgi:hypothetical protein